MSLLHYVRDYLHGRNPKSLDRPSDSVGRGATAVVRDGKCEVFVNGVPLPQWGAFSTEDKTPGGEQVDDEALREDGTERVLRGTIREETADEIWGRLTEHERKGYIFKDGVLTRRPLYDEAEHLRHRATEVAEDYAQRYFSHDQEETDEDYLARLRRDYRPNGGRVLSSDVEPDDTGDRWLRGNGEGEPERAPLIVHDGMVYGGVPVSVVTSSHAGMRWLAEHGLLS